jgi:hypothetical protein
MSDESIYDILRTFDLVKNVEEGMNQQEWINMLNYFESYFKAMGVSRHE